MERDELMQLIGSLRTDDISEDMGNLITQISDAVNSVFDNTDRLTSANNEYIRANEQLRSANMKLFMQIGEAPKPAEPKPEDKTEEKLTFDNLLKGI